MNTVFQEKIKGLRLEETVFIFDFDGTINKKYNGTVKTPSIISIFRNENILNEEYSKQAHALMSLYQPIELDPSIPLETKIQKMEEWWQKHIHLLIKHKLSRKSIRKVSYHKSLIVRNGIIDLFSFAKDNGIPIIIFSASGTGSDSIRFFLERHAILFENVTIISNRFEYKDDLVTAYIPPLIHALNKDEAVLGLFPEIHKMILERKDVLLFGDSMNDVNMVLDHNHRRVVRVGLLNEKDPEGKIDLLQRFTEKFDLVIEDDKGLELVYNILLQLKN